LATKKISALTDGVTANASDKIPVERSGANKYITPAMLWSYLHPYAHLDNDVSPYNNITIATSTNTYLSFDNIVDTGGFYSAGQPTRLTIPAGAGGRYLITAQIRWSVSSGSGQRDMRIVKNSNIDIGRDNDGLTTHINAVYQSLAITRTLAAGDYVRLFVNQTSGGNLDIQQDDDSPIFSIIRVG
jgi:hypothetical protein